MSKEIDTMLDDLLKEIDAQDGQEAEVQKPASQEAVKRAEAIVTGVNQSYRRPPEPVRASIPAPNLKEVVEPEPTSHFSDEPSSDPAIRMHDRLDESSLPGLDAERRPTRIRGIDGSEQKTNFPKPEKRSLPTPPAAPKRRIPHIQVPDELPPDVSETPPTAPVSRPEADPEREALVKSRAEKIREQLRKRTLEETPIIPPPSEEEIDNMIDGIEYPNGHPKTEEEKNKLFSYLHQVLGVEESEEALTDVEEPAEDAERWFDDEPESESANGSLFSGDTYGEYDDEEASREEDEDSIDEEDDESSPHLRHLEEEEEVEERKESRLAAFFRGLFRKHTAEADEHELESDEFDESDEEDEAFEPEEDSAFAAEDDSFASAEEEETFAAEDDNDSFAPEKEADTFAVKEEDDGFLTEEEDDSFASEEEEEKHSDWSSLIEQESESDETFGFDESEPESEVPAEQKPEKPFEEEFEDEPEEEFERDSKPKHHFFKEAFDESAEELAEMKSEQEPKPEQDDDIKTRFLGRNSYFVAGVIVLLLALVGLVTFVSGIVKAAGGFFSGGSLKDQLEQALYPVAVVDMPSFNEPAELTAEGALSAAIVDILMHDDLSGYTETFDMISVPAEDVLERGRRMFGVDVQTQLDTLHAGGESFVYDAQSNCFNVPAEPMIFSYAPEVRKIQRNGDTYEVTVIYHGDVASWQTKSRNFTQGTTKTMQATIEKKQSGYRIVRLVPAQ